MTERELFEAALDREPDDRAAFLDRACAAAPLLKERVEALLALKERAGSFLEGAAAVGIHATDVRPNGAAQAVEAVGQVLAGRYRLLEQIGEGGMGSVWLALQTKPIRREVAVKLIKAGMDSRMVLSRFDAERQALALMDHPNIAKVLDGGSTEKGRPFFVMEYVKGVPITQYCADAHLSVAERLELFVLVCQAVQHAHQKGVIHRDLKPSNLLICLYDDKPVPKVIDFGLAKAMHEPLTDHTLYTAHGLMLGTPLYMSPEQVAVNNLDVDTRSDIYSLGVVLYELLTGTTPLEKEQLKQASWPEVLRLITDTEPPKPSTRLADVASTAERAARQAGTLVVSRPPPLATRRFQELDWIVMKALDKDRIRRYETANGLARDVHRFLHDEPVEANPPSAWYRFSKFTRRNKMALRLAAVAVLVLLVLGGGAGWVLWDRAARQTERQREKAARSAETEGAVSVALAKAQQLAEQAGQMPIATSGEAAAVLVMWRQADDALAQATAALSTGEPDNSLRQSVSALKVQLEAGRQQAERGRARSLRKEQLFRNLDEARATGWAMVDNHFDYKGAVAKYAAAIAAYEHEGPAGGIAELTQRIRAEAPEVREALIVALDDWANIAAHEQSVWSATDIRTLAGAADNNTWRQRYRAAVTAKDWAALRDLSAAARRSSLPPSSLVLLATSLLAAGDRAEALALLRLGRSRYPTDFWLHFNSGASFGAEKSGNPVEVEEAIGCYRTALALRPAASVIHYNLGLIALQAKNQVDEAIFEFRLAIDLDPKYAWAHHNLASCLRIKNHLNDAIAEYRKAIELDPKSAPAHSNLGTALHSDNQVDKAIAEFRLAISLDPNYARAHCSLGTALQHKNQLDEANVEFHKAIDLDPKSALTHYNLGIVLGQMGEWDKALAEYASSIELDPKSMTAWANRSQAYAVLGQWPGAAADMGKSLDPSDTEQWMKLAAYRLQAGDTAGYEAACAAMLERFGQTNDPIHAHRIALSCLLIPRPPFDQQLPVELAERSAASLPQNHWCLITRGAALYRDGQFEAASAQLRQVLKTWPENPYARPGVDGTPIVTWLFLAMANHRLGHAADARLWLDKAVKRMDRELGEKKIGPVRQLSHIWAMCLVLRREAEGLLNTRGTDQPKRPPTKQSP